MLCVCVCVYIYMLCARVCVEPGAISFAFFIIGANMTKVKGIIIIIHQSLLILLSYCTGVRRKSFTPRTCAA